MNPQFYTIYLWASMAISIPAGAYLIYKYVNAVRGRPEIREGEILFEERFASGHSTKNILYKLGGASNCLRLVVTRELLWITSWFPFSLITPFYDLEHVIPRNRITSVESDRRAIVLTYVGRAGVTHTLRLFPKDRGGFLRALGKDMNSGET